MYGQVLFHQSVSQTSRAYIFTAEHQYFCRPTGGVAAAILFFFLNLNPHQGRTLKQHAQEFDFVGLLLFVAGIVMLLLGFNESETSCEHG